MSRLNHRLERIEMERAAREALRNAEASPAFVWFAVVAMESRAAMAAMRARNGVLSPVLERIACRLDLMTDDDFRRFQAECRQRLDAAPPDVIQALNNRIRSITERAA